MKEIEIGLRQLFGDKVISYGDEYKDDMIKLEPEQIVKIWEVLGLLKIK